MTILHDSNQDVSGVVLAGGRAERLGGIDKGLLRVHARPLVGEVFISANRSLERYARYGHPVLPDEDFPLAGPLAGIHEAMKRMRGEWLLVLPCDAVGVTAALLDRLLAARAPGVPALVAEDGERWHPTFSLIHRSRHPEWFRNLNRPEDVRAAEGAGR